MADLTEKLSGAQRDQDLVVSEQREALRLELGRTHEREIQTHVELRGMLQDQVAELKAQLASANRPCSVDDDNVNDGQWW